MVLFGRYIEVIPHSRLVWTNDEGGDVAVTTVTFEEKGGTTLPLPGWKAECPRRSRNWTSCSSPWKSYLVSSSSDVRHAAALSFPPWLER